MGLESLLKHRFNIDCALIQYHSSKRGLRPLACWDCGFESRWIYGYLFLVNVASCAGRGLCDGPILRPGKSYRAYVI